MVCAICMVIALAPVAGGSSKVFGSCGTGDGFTPATEDETSLLQVMVARTRPSSTALQRKASMDSQLVSPSLPQPQIIVHSVAPVITCSFTVADVVDSVYYNGQDITSSVEGKLNDWYDVKNVTFSVQPGAYLVVSGHNNEGHGCFNGGFQMTCSNGASSDDYWQAFGSTLPLEAGRLAGSGSDWSYPCISTANSFLRSDPTVRRIWATNDAFAAFRLQIFPDQDALAKVPMPASPKVVSCLFTVNDVVDAVYYNEKDITASVIGDRFKWPTTKQVTVDVVPNAYFVVLGHNNEEHSCSTGGFMIYCTNGVTTRSGWEAYSTSAVLPLTDVHRLGEGEGWHSPCDSGAEVSLDDKPEMPKIFASDEKFAAFRIRLVKSPLHHAQPDVESQPSGDCGQEELKDKLKRALAAESAAEQELALMKQKLADKEKTPVEPPLPSYGILVKPGVSAGDSHSCQLSKDGLVSCWGRNVPEGRATPLLGVGPYTAISTGYATTCGIISGGQAYCWGNNAEGQAAPPNNGAGPFKAISVGRIHACGIRSTDNLAVCWGSTSAPVGSPPAGGKYSKISVSDFHSCAIKASDGSAECWGLNSMSQADPPHLEISKYSDISAGGHHTCAVRTSDEAAVCWGGNDLGQATAPSGKFEAVSVGGKTSCGLNTDGEIKCWGENNEQQASPPTGTDFEAVSVGFAHACAVKKMGGNATGQAACWGRNTYGQAEPDWLWDH